MVFSSATFLLGFLPVTLLLYFIVPTRPAKNIVLLALSLVFYAWGEPVYVFLMIASITFNWLFAIAIDKQEGGSKNAVFVASLVVNLAILGFFKYEGFLAENVNALFGTTVIPNLELSLPLAFRFLPCKLFLMSSTFTGAKFLRRKTHYTLACTLQCFRN